MLAASGAVVGYVVLVAVWLGLAFLCARLAVKKGRPAGLFFFLGLILPGVCLVILAFIHPTQYDIGHVVELITNVKVANGPDLQAGLRSTVHEVTVIDNTRVLGITDSAGTRRFVAATAVKLST